jgi:hypothetical protein
MDKRHLETTLAITQAMAGELADYLMGDALYRQLVVKTPSGTKQPKMTLGALLESIDLLRWDKDNLSRDQQSALAAIEQAVDLGRSSFSQQWQAHLRRELKSLLDSWRWYLDDAGRSADARENYAREVHIRTRIDLVMRALAGDASLADSRRQLGELDARLRGVIHGGAYVGPQGEQSHYPPSQAWWLYGQPGAE